MSPSEERGDGLPESRQLGDFCDTAMDVVREGLGHSSLGDWLGTVSSILWNVSDAKPEYGKEASSKRGSSAHLTSTKPGSSFGEPKVNDLTDGRVASR